MKSCPNSSTKGPSSLPLLESSTGGTTCVYFFVAYLFALKAVTLLSYSKLSFILDFRNFTRVTRGPETGAYYHPLFQRGDLRLCMQMSCISSKSAQQLQPMNPVALGLTMPLPGQPMVHGMMPMQGGDGGDNFMRLRQLEEQRQNFLLQQQKQQQQIMALAGFGGQGGAPAQVGSTPGFAPQPGMAPAPSSGQQGQPQQQTSGCGQTGQSLQPGQFQQIPNGQPNPMASNPYIAMLMQQGMMNPQQMQQMQMNGGQSASGQTQLPIQIPMQMNPAMQAQFFAFQQNAMMQAQQQQQQLQQPLQGEQQGQQIVQEVQTQLEADGTQEGQQQQQTNSLQQNQQQMQSQIHPTMLQPQMAMGADSQNMILLPQEDQQQQQQQEPLKSEEQTEDGH